MSDVDSVTAAYDRIASAWRADRLARSTEFRERRLIDRLTDGLPAHANILDVGCGCGQPIASYLTSRGFAVTGLDGSSELLAFAPTAVPEAAFVLRDMRTATLGGQFDGLVAWDCVFHIPRDDHEGLFTRFHSWLLNGGRLLSHWPGRGPSISPGRCTARRFRTVGTIRRKLCASSSEPGSASNTGRSTILRRAGTWQ